MKRVWLGGLGVLASVLLVQGCFALDWDFRGAAGAGGGGGDASSSSSANSSSNSSSSSSSSTSGTPANEDCTNGGDDNGDGKADCKDPDCGSEYECNVAVPVGWSPVWMLEKAYQDSNATDCPGGLPLTTLFVDPATAAESTCTPCNCSYMGATCGGPKFECYHATMDCTGTSEQFHPLTINCNSLTGNSPGGFQSCMLLESTPPLMKGTCNGAPSGIVGPPKFGKELRMCPWLSKQGGGCNGGNACTEIAPETLSGARACIEQAGTTTCPDGWKATAFAAYESGTEERKCTDCECDTNTVTCIGGGPVRLSSFDGCPGGLDLTVAGACVPTIAGSPFRSADNFSFGTPKGECTTPVASGIVVGEKPHTICCRD